MIFKVSAMYYEKPTMLLMSYSNKIADESQGCHYVMYFQYIAKMFITWRLGDSTQCTFSISQRCSLCEVFEIIHRTPTLYRRDDHCAMSCRFYIELPDNRFKGLIYIALLYMYTGAVLGSWNFRLTIGASVKLVYICGN